MNDRQRKRSETDDHRERLARRAPSGCDGVEIGSVCDEGVVSPVGPQPALGFVDEPYGEQRGEPVIVQATASARSETDAQTLWEVSVELTGVSFSQLGDASGS